MNPNELKVWIAVLAAVAAQSTEEYEEPIKRAARYADEAVEAYRLRQRAAMQAQYVPPYIPGHER